MLKTPEKKVSKIPRGDLYYYLDSIETVKFEKVSTRRSATTNSIREDSHHKVTSKLLDPLERLYSPGTKDINVTAPNTINDRERERTESRKNSSIYQQTQTLKKKSADKFTVDAEKIRRKCVKEFQASWSSKDKIGGYGERPGGAIQLLDEEPIRFWTKDIDHEDFNIKNKQFRWFDEIKQESKNGIK